MDDVEKPLFQLQILVLIFYKRVDFSINSWDFLRVITATFSFFLLFSSSSLLKVIVSYAQLLVNCKELNGIINFRCMAKKNHVRDISRWLDTFRESGIMVDHCKIWFSRSRGPGGQHVNK